MKYFIVFIFLLLIPILCFSQESDMCLAIGAYSGIMPKRTRDYGYERKSAFFWELELAFNFNKHFTISLNYDQTSTQTKDFKEDDFYNEKIRGLALGLRYSPLKTRLNPFCELQALIYHSSKPDKIIFEPEQGIGSPYAFGVNFGNDVKYTVIKELDALLKAKFNTYYYNVSLGLNYNFPLNN